MADKDHNTQTPDSELVDKVNNTLVNLKFSAYTTQVEGLINGDYNASTIGELYKQASERLKEKNEELYKLVLPYFYEDKEMKKISSIPVLTINLKVSTDYCLETPLGLGDSVWVFFKMAGG